MAQAYETMAGQLNHYAALGAACHIAALVGDEPILYAAARREEGDQFTAVAITDGELCYVEGPLGPPHDPQGFKGIDARLIPLSAVRGLQVELSWQQGGLLDHYRRPDGLTRWTATVDGIDEALNLPFGSHEYEDVPPGVVEALRRGLHD